MTDIKSSTDYPLLDCPNCCEDDSILVTKSTRSNEGYAYAECASEKIRCGYKVEAPTRYEVIQTWNKASKATQENIRGAGCDLR